METKPIIEHQLLLVFRRVAQVVAFASGVLLVASLLGMVQWLPPSAWLLSTIGWSTAAVLLTDHSEEE